VKFRLTIEQFATNPNYVAELEKWNELRRLSGRCNDQFNGEPRAETTVKVLTVEVTDVEFAAIKKAALATMA
jgi:hypothetical protein